MVAVPNYTVGNVSPNGANQGDMWFDTNTGRLNIFNGTNFSAVTTPAITAAMTNSTTIAGAVAANGGPLLVPALTGSMGGTWTIPAGYVGLAVDVANNRINVVGSGGTTFRTVAIA